MTARPTTPSHAAVPAGREPVPGDDAALVDLTRLAGRVTGMRVGRAVRLLALDETGGGVRCHKQRAADAAVTAAARDGYGGVVVGSCGNYGWAVARSARAAGLAAIVVVPAGFAVDTGGMIAAGARVVRAGTTYEDAVAASRRLTGRGPDPSPLPTGNGVVTRCGPLADVNVDGPYARAVDGAHRRIVEAIADSPDDSPDVLWIPLGNGTTVAAVGGAVLDRGWRCRVVGVSSRCNNSVLAAWPGRCHSPLDPELLKPTAANEPLVNCDALHGQTALDTLHATGGLAVGVSDAALLDAGRLLRRAGLRVSPAGAAGVAGLLAAVRNNLRGGTHVAVLTG